MAPEQLRFGTLFTLIGLTALIGLVPATLVYVAICLQIWWKRAPLLNLILGCIAGAALLLLAQLMGLRYPPGLLQVFAPYPHWLGG